MSSITLELFPANRITTQKETCSYSYRLKGRDCDSLVKFAKLASHHRFKKLNNNESFQKSWPSYWGGRYQRLHHNCFFSLCDIKVSDCWSNKTRHLKTCGETLLLKKKPQPHSSSWKVKELYLQVIDTCCAPVCLCCYLCRLYKIKINVTAAANNRAQIKTVSNKCEDNKEHYVIQPVCEHVEPRRDPTASACPCHVSSPRPGLKRPLCRPGAPVQSHPGFVGQDWLAWRGGEATACFFCSRVTAGVTFPSQALSARSPYLPAR